MQKDIQNISANSLFFNSLGLALSAGATKSLDSFPLDLIYDANDIFSAIDAGQIKLITDFKEITSGAEAKPCFYPSTITNITNLLWRSCTSNNMVAVDEIAFANTIKASLSLRYPVMLADSTFGAYMLLDGSYGNSVINNISGAFYSGNGGFQVSTTNGASNNFETFEDYTGWTTVGKTNIGSFARSSAQVKAGSYSRRATINSGHPADSIGTKATIYSTNWTSYKYISMWVYGSGKESVYFSINDTVIPCSEIRTISGWQQIIIDMSMMSRSAVTSYTFWVRPLPGATFPFYTYFDRGYLYGSVTYTGNSGIGDVYGNLRTTDLPVAQVYCCALGAAPTGTSYKMDFTLDNGGHWYEVPDYQMETWLDVTTLGVSWDNRKNIKIGTNLYAKSDYTATPNVYGLLMLYRV